MKKSLRKEFKRQLRLALTAAIGFVIAYSWRDAINNVMNTLSINLSGLAGLGNSPFFAPILATIIGVVFIFILSELLKE